MAAGPDMPCVSVALHAGDTGRYSVVPAQHAGLYVTGLPDCCCYCPAVVCSSLPLMAPCAKRQ